MTTASPTTAERGRFDSDPDKPYGSCKTCGIELPTEQSATDHRKATFEPAAGGSHTTRGTNPGRADRIRSSLGMDLDSALHEFFEAAERLVERGDASLEEVTNALRHLDPVDLVDAWTEWQDES